CCCTHEGRTLLQPDLDLRGLRLIRIVGDLDDRLAAPTVARPTLGHDGPPPRLTPGTGKIFQLGGPYTRGPAPQARWNCEQEARAQTKRGVIRPPRGDGSAPSPVASPVPRRRSDAPR